MNSNWVCSDDYLLCILHLYFTTLIAKWCVRLVYQWWFDGRTISYVDSYKRKRKRKGRWWRVDRGRENKKANHYLFLESAVSMYDISAFASFFFFICCLYLFCSLSSVIFSFLPISNDNVSVHSTYFQILFDFLSFSFSVLRQKKRMLYKQNDVSSLICIYKTIIIIYSLMYKQIWR
jgi:hypothetical protein